MSKPNCLFIFESFAPYSIDRIDRLRSDLAVLQTQMWVYVAHGECPDCEDDEHGIRYLRWRREIIQSFGRLEVIVVADDALLAASVRKMLRPEARVLELSMRQVDSASLVNWVLSQVAPVDSAGTRGHPSRQHSRTCSGSI